METAMLRKKEEKSKIGEEEKKKDSDEWVVRF